MPFHTNHNIRLAAASLLALLLSSYLFANNGHAEELREISKVNGGIRIAASEQVGEVSSVNGGIDIGRNARATSVETVNGGIRVDDNVIVRRSLETTNGGIRVGSGSKVGGTIETVNGKITLDNTHVGDSVITTNGDVLIRNGSVIEGDVVFEGRRRGWTRWFNWGNKRPDLVIDADAEVKGDIRLYHEVTLKIAEGARVGDIKRHYRD
ncbi:hypothetical protein N9M23_02000 [Gammaproteobacteria bacterium]|jgi:DUF4097 and DUF4098 domain-containing protein YvlB|nr:hypothetical protein [Gammaproteobacteria bacterium]MBT7764103.1 hypothetical protein [Gammaproteobacteria bacterium]MDA8617031.1 hypothetical protein [Gammaproteobacteria bacterium]